MRSASARQPARRLGSRPVVSITVVSLRASRLATISSSSSNASSTRALVALAGADDRAQPVRRDDLRRRANHCAAQCDLPAPLCADEHDEAGVGQAQRHS